MAQQHKTKANFDVPAQRFYENVDIERLKDFMSDDPEMETFYRALMDPEYSKLNFSTLCRKFNISLSKLQQVYTDGMRHLGLLAMSTHLPTVMADVAEDAKSRYVLCNRCDGEGTVRQGGNLDDGGARVCPVCNGDKKVRVVGDKHARDLVFESMKLTNQNGPLVNINQNFGNEKDDSMESMFKLTQSISVGKRDAIEEADKVPSHRGSNVTVLPESSKDK